MLHTRFSTMSVSVVVAALLAQLVIFPEEALAQWRSNVPNQTSDEEVLTYIVGAALLTGGMIVYLKHRRNQSRRPTGGSPLSMLSPLPTRHEERNESGNGEESEFNAGFAVEPRALWLTEMREAKVLIGWDSKNEAPSLTLHWSF